MTKAEREADKIVREFMEYQTADKFPGPEPLRWSERMETWMRMRISDALEKFANPKRKA